MKKIMALVLALAVLFMGYKIDKTYYMPKRISKFTWIYSHGYYVGDVINPERYIIKGDTIMFLDGKFSIVKYQFYDYLIISDSINNHTGTYEKIGSHWSK